MIALLLAATLSAAAPGAQADESLKLGTTKYRAGDFEGALKELEQAASSEDMATRSKARLTQGLCFAALQRFDRVNAAFEAALIADPEAQLDPTRVQPAVVALLDAARARLSGELSVTAADERRLSIDGSPAGVTPLERAIAIGRHRIEAEDASGRIERREIVVHARQVVILAFEAAPPPTHPAPPVDAPAPAPNELNALAELRATLDPRDYVGSLAQARTGPAPELAAGVGGKYWGATLGVMGGAAIATTLRVTGRLPFWGPLAAELSLQGALFFTSPLAGSGAALLGLSVAPVRWLEIVASGGGGFVLGTSELRHDYVLISLAVRLRLFG